MVRSIVIVEVTPMWGTTEPCKHEEAVEFDDRESYMLHERLQMLQGVRGVTPTQGIMYVVTEPGKDSFYHVLVGIGSVIERVRAGS